MPNGRPRFCQNWITVESVWKTSYLRATTEWKYASMLVHGPVKDVGGACQLLVGDG